MNWKFWKRKKTNPFEVKLVNVQKGKEHPYTIMESMGIPRQRAIDLEDIVNQTIKKVKDNEGGYYNDSIIHELSLQVNSAAEFALVMYTFSAINVIDKMKSDKRNELGGFLGKLLGGSIKGIVLGGGNMGGNPFNSSQSSSTGEDPDIEALIRKSYEINKDKDTGEEENQ